MMQTTTSHPSVIIIGGGPAGLMAANVFANANIDFILLEKNERVGKKLLITGNKRSNVTNTDTIDAFIQALTLKHKRFLYPSLLNLGPKEIVSFFANRGLTLVSEDGFKYFPSTNRSQSVLDALLIPIKASAIKTNQAVTAILKQDDLYQVSTKTNVFYAKHVIVATGSNAYPTTGSSGDGLKFAKAFEIPYHPFTPAETVVYSNDVKTKFADLQGLSLESTEVRLENTKIKQTGSLMFTHFGLTGPAILHASESIYHALEKGHNQLLIRLTDYDEPKLQKMVINAKQQNKPINLFLEQVVKKKLAKKLMHLLAIEPKNMNEISQKKLQDLIRFLLHFPITIDAVESKENAIVNAGGVLTKALNPHSMEVLDQSGLYFIGETIDLHGPIGGYNLTIAFSTAYTCAKAIVKILALND